SLGDGDGLTLIRQLKKDEPARPILVLTVKRDGETAVRAIRAGATGYVAKDNAGHSILEAVRRAAAGKHYVDEWLAEHLAARLAQDAASSPYDCLSDRELQVLILIATGKRQSVIADQLALSPKTVATYRRRVLEKLAVRSNAELAVYAVRHGVIDA
ncbi:MAG: response regulator transcription factor, partial [Acidobacteriota bacterium]